MSGYLLIRNDLNDFNQLLSSRFSPDQLRLTITSRNGQFELSDLPSLRSPTRPDNISRLSAKTTHFCTQYTSTFFCILHPYYICILAIHDYLVAKFVVTYKWEVWVYFLAYQICPNYITYFTFIMKLKIKAGAAAAVLTVESELKVLDLSSHFAGTQLEDLSITSYRFGFPAKTVDATSNETLQDAGVRANDQLIAQLGNQAQSPAAQAKPSVAKDTKVDNDKIANVHIPSLGQYVILRNVPDDNSCLFNAILYALMGAFKWPDVNLRHVVAETIRNSPETYDEVVLGRPTDTYCEWIEKNESWGGAIELGILAEFLGVRINCFDVELGSRMVFQDENRAPLKFIVLVYSGIHYDCFVTNVQLTETKTNDQGNWTAHEDEIVGASDKLVQLLQKRNYTTNTTKFRVRCLECYQVLVGEMGASKHAEATGHFRFGEVN